MAVDSPLIIVPSSITMAFFVFLKLLIIRLVSSGFKKRQLIRSAVLEIVFNLFKMYIPVEHVLPMVIIVKSFPDSSN